MFHTPAHKQPAAKPVVKVVAAAKPRPIFILSSVVRAAGSITHPTDIQVVAWTDVCQGQKGKDFVFIEHVPGREPSRWTYAKNKRPFVVYTRRWCKLGASSTLEGALKIARREA